MNWIRKIFGIKKKEFAIPKDSEYLNTRDPEKPINFGIKTVWCAIKSDDHKKVADFLKLDSSKTCDWIEGTIRANEGEIFIIPSIENWVIIHGWGIPIPNNPYDLYGSDKFINALSSDFGEAHLYGNHRVSSSVFWMKSINGKLERYYIAMDGVGVSKGEPTELEQKWNLIDWSSPEIENEEYLLQFLYPGEEEVIQVAASWSINPMEIETLVNTTQKGIYRSLKK